MKKPRRMLRAKRSAWQPMERACNSEGKHHVEIAGETFTMWKNDIYTVHRQEIAGAGDWPAMVHLSIRRNDRHPIRDWRHFQRIKNDLVGDENEGVELYPAESRLIDGANQYHLYVIKDPAVRFPCGYHEGRQVTSDTSDVPKARQRPHEG